ncbi:MAG: hypothetical protein KAW02_05565 [candidate division Zixibacteria bacterium]|nr:hypothetical protein [candidate division Zixibacteria bacterium]
MDERGSNKTAVDTPQGAFHPDLLRELDPSSTVPLAARAQEYPWVPRTATAPHLVSFYVIERRDIDQLIEENVRLRQDISDLSGKVAELVEILRGDYISRAENFIVLREISMRQAKKEIVKLFQKSGSLYYSDIAEQLRLDLELVVDLCAELEKEGKIKPKQ